MTALDVSQPATLAGRKAFEVGPRVFNQLAKLTRLVSASAREFRSGFGQKGFEPPRAVLSMMGSTRASRSFNADNGRCPTICSAESAACGSRSSTITMSANKADSNGRRNTSTGEIGMTIQKRRSDRSGRAALRSPAESWSFLPHEKTRLASGPDDHRAEHQKNRTTLPSCSGTILP
jgi:hypothetical protein